MAKVHIELLDGADLTGELFSFNPNLPVFHLQRESADGAGQTEGVRIDSVAVIHFLKKHDESASPIRTETIDQTKMASNHAFHLTVELASGNVLTGSTHKYSPNDVGFFLVPLSPADAAERIYVNATAARRVESRRLLGRILVDQRKITPTQLAEGIAHHHEERSKRIGTILRDARLITDQQLAESLHVQKEKQRFLGEILLDARYITQEQLDHALRIQQDNRRKRLGQVLVELKYITPNDLCIALATQLEIAWVDLATTKPDPKAVSALRLDVARRLLVVPIDRRGPDRLVVAASEPQDPSLAPTLREATGMNIELVVAYEVYISEILEALVIPSPPG